MYLWGNASFGIFETPHRVKTISSPVIAISVGDQFGACLAQAQEKNGTQRLYTWGDNQLGQLGTGDFKETGTPIHLEIGQAGLKR